MSKTCSLATLGIWKKTDEPFVVYFSHHPGLVLFLSHCPSFKAARIPAQGLAGLCPLLVWSSPGSGQPHPCSEPGSSVLPAQAAAAWQQLSRLAKLSFQLVFSIELGCTAWAIGFESSFLCLHKRRSDPSLEICCWDVNCGAGGECLPALPWSRSALSSPLYSLMNLFVFLCQLSYLTAKVFTLKIAQYEAPEEVAQPCGPQCHEYAGCVSWSVFPVLYPCFAQRTLLHFIICFLKEDCEFLYGSPCTCDCSQK